MHGVLINKKSMHEMKSWVVFRFSHVLDWCNIPKSKKEKQ